MNADGVELHECRACGGVFASHDALSALVAKSGADADIARASTAGPGFDDTRFYLRCPGCDQPMNRARFADQLPLVIDSCRKDGVWFDGGELTRALSFVARGGQYDARRLRGPRASDPKPARASRSAALANSALMAEAASTSAEARGAAMATEIGAELLVALLSSLFDA